MNEEAHSPGNFSNLRWPIIGFVVVAVLLGLKMILVNKSGEVPVVAPAPVAYSKPGPIVSGNVTIGAGEFLSKQIILNRRAKLSGEFQTGSVKSKIAVVVIDEADFENWKQQTEFKARVGTGYVPGGKISPMLEPGNYFLIIDNRANESSQSVEANFVLE
ncbi:MAG: hypothetical protein DMF63_17170 [Acidobacteria bacterium]|nr:MAG: hypothetical protein DMF63_17170 [Acidobacteriota bacterium]